MDLRFFIPSAAMPRAVDVKPACFNPSGRFDKVDDARTGGVPPCAKTQGGGRRLCRWEGRKFRKRAPCCECRQITILSRREFIRASKMFFDKVSLRPARD